MLEKIAVISYRREDSVDVTGRIYDRLIVAFGKKAIFKDMECIPLGVHFAEHISSTIEKCHVVLAVIGKQWWGRDETNGQRRIDETEDFVRLEIEEAFKHKIPVIPLLIKGSNMPEENELPKSLKRLAFCNGIPVRSDPDFHRDVDTLIAGLERLGFQRQDTNPAANLVNLPTEISANLHTGTGSIPILQVPFTIGRHVCNSLTLPNNNVSKRHARITLANKRFYLEDLGSTNGVYIIQEQEAIKLRTDEQFPLNFRTCIRLGKNDTAPLLTFELEEQTIIE
ncbi:MAG: FHA domain-containing protein [Verrucomicrobiota bacterium]